MPIAHFVVWSDYLCPWCYNAAVRLGRLREEFGADVRFEWRSYLLRPHRSPRRDLESFRAYTASWLRPAAEPDSGTFQVWQGDAGPPSHSVPPHLVAKAAALLGDESFERIHAGLLQAYFGKSRDITDERVLRALWDEAGLPSDAFTQVEDPKLLRLVLGQHDEALALGVTGVPTVILEGNGALVLGAQPLALYRRWIKRVIEA